MIKKGNRKKERKIKWKIKTGEERKKKIREQNKRDWVKNGWRGIKKKKEEIMKIKIKNGKEKDKRENIINQNEWKTDKEK